ncbi:hypothetical protein QAD02_004216 [Eretmocerus hayati]|uniref:Uncharacterized protein n=1 Tax=Eretmocerus hayati TaxID=131215 RepID=A0ACC2NNX6_9HYME|nr:hypothetical protein QAD02_004216 [Eretmocerus hayati]
MNNFHSLYTVLLVLPSCLGQSSTDLDTKLRIRRIAGGSSVDSEQLSYITIVSICSSTSGEAFCAGTILSQKVILTASHCTNGFPDQPICISLGEPYQTGRIEPYIEVASIEVHPNYNLPDELSDAINDIALIVLSEDLYYSVKRPSLQI